MRSYGSSRSSRPTSNRPLTALLACATLCLVAAAASPAFAQQGKARVSGTVVDEAGNPIEGVSLEFAPQGAAAKIGQTLKVKKKGKFSSPFFPSGLYKVSLVSPDYFIKTMEYVMRTDTNQELERTEGPAHPKTGLPPFRITAGHKIELNFVVASMDEKAKMVQQVATFEAQGKLKKISDLYGQGDMEGVLAEADDLLAKDPELGAAIYLRGAALWKLGRTDEAEQALRRAIELAPDQEGIWGVLGTVLLDRSEQLEDAGQAAEGAELAYEAAGYFAKDLEEHPDSMASLINRAAALDRAERDDELEPALRAVIAADPSNVTATTRLVTLLIRSGRREDALELLENSQGGDQTLAAALYNVAANFYNDGDLDTATRAANKALEIDPDLPETHRLLSRIHLGREDKAAAIAEIERYLELAPDAADAAAERQLLEALKKGS